MARAWRRRTRWSPSRATRPASSRARRICRRSRRSASAARRGRRKCLRSPATEVGHAVDVLTRLAVASPAAGFRLEHDGREVLAFPPVAGARQRLVQVLGRERAEGLVPVEAAAGGYALT